MHHATAIRIAQLFYDALHRRFEAVVEFFAPGLPVPLCVPVRLHAPPDLAHPQLVRALTRKAQHRGIGGI